MQHTAKSSREETRKLAQAYRARAKKTQCPVLAMLLKDRAKELEEEANNA